MSADDGVRAIGTAKQLLFDDALVARKQGFGLKAGCAVRTGARVLVPDRPWEEGGIIGDSGATVIEDDGVLKLWYMTPHLDLARIEPGRQVRSLGGARLDGLDAKARNDLLSRARYLLCYAVSSDGGAHWEKPDLGVFDYDGSRKNNIVFAGRLGGTVFKDPTAPPEQAYKMIYGGGPRLPHWPFGASESVGDHYNGIHGACSPDGIHWRPHPAPIVPWYTDSTNVCFWDDRIAKYVAYVRWDQGMVYGDGRTMVVAPGGFKYRAIGRTESDDFRRFPPPVKILAPPKKDREPRRTGMDYYNSSAVKYPLAADAYLMFISFYYHDWGTLDVHVATSRDGVRWRPWRTPFLGIGPKGTFDCERVYMATGMVRRGDELDMFYVGTTAPHPCERFPRGSVDRAKVRNGIGRVRVRLDGFVSQDASRAGGSLVTAPIAFEGARLEVNLDAGAGGRLRVEILDAAGQPCAGHSEGEADWVWGNGVRRVMTWNGNPDVSALAGKPVRLRFVGAAAKLYAFQFVDGPDRAA